MRPTMLEASRMVAIATGAGSEPLQKPAGAAVIYGVLPRIMLSFR